ncbi:MAG: hypothetical protein H0X01_08460 [Nitrospira sp.]|nr:hypothetical protein [Nitrospira sp.]
MTWLIAILGIVASIALAAYQERQSNVDVVCNLVEGDDPSKLECKVSNMGRSEARDLSISFATMLPVGTQVVGPPEFSLSLQPVDSPPDPGIDPRTAGLTTAFVVIVPRIAAQDHFSFIILTSDPDNKRAAAQLQRIQDESKKILDDFGERLAKTNPADAHRWHTKDVMSAYRKRQCFFSPARYSFEAGRRDVFFLSEDELWAEALNADLYPRYKTRFIDIYQNRPEFLASVVRIVTKAGDSTYAMYPPYVRSYVNMLLRADALQEQGSSFLRPPVPKEY